DSPGLAPVPVSASASKPLKLPREKAPASSLIFSLKRSVKPDEKSRTYRSSTSNALIFVGFCFLQVSQDAAGAPRPAPRLIQALTPLQRPVSLVSPGFAAPPVCSSNGCLKPPLPQAPLSPEDRVPAHTWFSPVQSPSKKRAAADVLFDSFSTDGRISVNNFFESIWSSGLHRSDLRLRESFFHMRKLQDSDGTIDRSSFHRCVTGSVSLILKAVQGRFVIPDFSTFTEETQKLFSGCRQLSSSSQREKENGGVDAVKWGVSICTVDGQR
uniref:glutaminase n=1 Tax=Neogobius melanostomus TaxID=47308 RepID=A0A8C6S3U2_9GOBI